MMLDAGSRYIDVWPDAERYLGGGTRGYSPFSADLDVDEAYHPQLGLPQFQLGSFRIPYEAGSFLVNGIPSSLPAIYRDGECFVLPVHPQTMAALDQHDIAQLHRYGAGPKFTVVPSANVRTVFVGLVGGEPVEPHFLKLHYPRRLSRFTRRLRKPIISLQLWVADELARLDLPFLPEVAGGVLGHSPTEAWGYLIREQRTSVAYDNTVPLFALYGSDVRSPTDPSLLQQLIVRSGESATSYLVDRIVVPMVRLWLTAALETGCALEMHGQNTLFQFSDDSHVTRIAYRDCGVYIDPAVRAARGLPDALPPVNVIGRDVSWPSASIFSLAYDSFAGHHALDFLAKHASDVFGVAVSKLHSAARKEFRAMSGAASLLPATVQYYDGALHPDGGWRLVDTGLPPAWR